MQALAFYFFAALTIIPSIFVVFSKNPMHSVFNLILTFCASAGLFILLGAEFLGMLLIVIYVGAVSVLFIFVIMMLEISKQEKSSVVDFLKHFFTITLKTFFFNIIKFTFYVIFIFALTITTLALILIAFSAISLFFVDGLPKDIELISYALYNLETFSEISKFLINEGKYFTIIFFILFNYITKKVVGNSFLSLLFSLCIKTCKSIYIYWIVAFVLFFEIILAIKEWKFSPFYDPATMSLNNIHEKLSNTTMIGMHLYTDYIYAFQASGIILLVAIIGSIVLSMNHKKDLKRQNISDQINNEKIKCVEMKDVKIGEGVEC